MGKSIITSIEAGLSFVGSAVAAVLRRRGTMLATLDRRTLSDIGIGPGEILLAGHEIGWDRLRRPPHV